jgi:hypothetical protein
MTTRAQAAENALASERAEGLDPGVAEALLCRWARGELSDARRAGSAPANCPRRVPRSRERAAAFLNWLIDPRRS